MTDEHPDQPGHRRLDTRTVLAVVAGVLLLWFAVENLQTVTIHFWVSSARAPIVLVIVVAAGLGGFVVWLSRRWHRPSRRGD